MDRMCELFGTPEEKLEVTEAEWSGIGRSHVLYFSYRRVIQQTHQTGHIFV